MPQQPCAHAVCISQGSPPTKSCDSPPWPHRPRCAITSSKGFCDVQCTGRASPRPWSQPSDAFPSLGAGNSTSVDGAAIHPGARGNILLALPNGISIAYVPVIHAPSINTLSAASDKTRSSSGAKGPAEAGGVWESGITWTTLCPLLCGVIWASRPASGRWSCSIGWEIQQSGPMGYRGRPL
jgi:hypothetical protein